MMRDFSTVEHEYSTRTWTWTVRTVREHQALHLEPMDALVAGVHDVLVHARAAYGPKFAVDEGDEVADGEAVVDERLRKGLEVGRPRGE